MLDEQATELPFSSIHMGNSILYLDLYIWSRYISGQTDRMLDGETVRASFLVIAGVMLASRRRMRLAALARTVCLGLKLGLMRYLVLLDR